jgi:phenylacetate-CoA ligase
LRKIIFEISDFFQGNPVNKQLKEIERLMAEASFDTIKAHQAAKLKLLLDAVVEKTEYYSPYKGYQRLEDFPVVNKYIIRENFEQINLPVTPKNRIKVKTSGSTGTPFEIYQTREKKNRNTADTIYFSRLAGFEIGYRLLYLRHWSAYYKKPSLLAFLQNIDQLEVEDLTEDYLETFISNLLKDKSPKSWIGYPSGFEKVISYFEAKKIEPKEANFKSIIAISETLFDATRQKMSNYFKCPVVSRYSNVENGILAQQPINGSYFIVNLASYVVEILELDTDKQAVPGTLGRIVVTDLYNFATPLIRYDTGDLGIMETSPSGILRFKRIEGRQTDVLTNTDGKILTPFIFHNSLSDYPEIAQVQLVQKDKEYTFKINTGGKDFRREQDFLEHYRAFFGKDAIIHVVYVDEVPITQSGKRRLIINENSSQTNA